MSDLRKFVKKEVTNILTRRSKIQENKKFHRIIKEEFKDILETAEKNRGQIETKLETMRKELISDRLLTSEQTGSGRNNAASRPERRIEIGNVAKIIDVPVNELMLFFLNGHRISEVHNSLFEYRTGCVYFYGDVAKVI